MRNKNFNFTNCRTWSPKHKMAKEDAVGEVFKTLARKRLFAKESEELKEVIEKHALT